MTEKKLSLIDQRRSTPEGRLGVAAARLALEASRLLAEAFLARKDLGQKAIAEMVGVSEGRVSQVLHGDGNVHIATLGRYMAALGYELELTAKPVDPSASPLKPRARRKNRARRRGQDSVSFDNGPIKFLYKIDTVRDSGIGCETIELHASPGETPPWPMSTPVLLSNKESGDWPAISTASEEVRERATKVLTKHR